MMKNGHALERSQDCSEERKEHKFSAQIQMINLIILRELNTPAMVFPSARAAYPKCTLSGF
jgi:hypothetical protein